MFCGFFRCRVFRQRFPREASFFQGGSLLLIQTDPREVSLYSFGRQFRVPVERRIGLSGLLQEIGIMSACFDSVGDNRFQGLGVSERLGGYFRALSSVCYLLGGELSSLFKSIGSR
jgi:hypothetical protein